MAKENSADGETDVLEAIAAMETPDREMAERLHEIVSNSAPELAPRTWYGMPAYAKDGSVLCFFHDEDDYMTFGLTDEANLAPAEDAPHQLIECSWFFSDLDDATEDELAEIVREAAS